MKKKILLLFGEKDYHAKKLVLSLKKKVNLKVNFFSKKKKLKHYLKKKIVSTILYFVLEASTYLVIQI